MEVIPHFPPLPLPPKISIMDMLVIVYLNSRLWNNGISVGIFGYHANEEEKDLFLARFSLGSFLWVFHFFPQPKQCVLIRMSKCPQMNECGVCVSVPSLA